tara:strand:+ start:5289 stop:5933 length:645 start_codon:yes stop_codon:yes gene_type:complete
MLIGFTIKLELPEEVKAGFPKLVDKMRRSVVRQAIRSALIAPKNVLKNKLMGLRSISKQSSGATFRAIITKYANSKSNPDRFYGLVGVDRKAYETIINQPSPKYRNARFRQINWGTVARHDALGNPVFSRRNPRREVRSGYRRNLSGPKKRIPKYYLHLWELGYNSSDKGPVQSHRYRSFRGHHFIQKTYQETEAEILSTFKTRVAELFLKASS